VKVDTRLCIGCGNCIDVCPMSARYVEDGVVCINEEECVECGACIRFTTPENANPWMLRALHSVLDLFHLRYDPPLDICPTGAGYQEELSWPRSVRQAFSDPTVTHAGTGVSGRGTEEIKTNDVTGRLQPGWAGVLVEFGRPGIGSRFHDVERVSTALAELDGVRFEPNNPVTQLMVDPESGRIDPDVLDEKVLSCILEVLVPMETLPQVLDTLHQTVASLDTVVSLVVNGRCREDGSVPYADIVAQGPFSLSPNGKTNLGLGRAGLPQGSENS